MDQFASVLHTHLGWQKTEQFGITNFLDKPDWMIYARVNL
jgi:hypothetical protein